MVGRSGRNVSTSGTSNSICRSIVRRNRAGQYQGKEVRVSGWFRRSPVPFLEVNKVEVLDESLPTRNCYSYHARLIAGFALALIGGAASVAVLFVKW